MYLLQLLSYMVGSRILSDLATDPFNLYVAGGVVVAPVPAVVPIEPDAPVPPEVPVAPVLPVEPVLPAYA